MTSTNSGKQCLFENHQSWGVFAHQVCSKLIESSRAPGQAPCPFRGDNRQTKSTKSN